MQIKLTRESILWAYRLLLDREPESQKSIDAQLQLASNTQELRHFFMGSQEFKNKNPQAHHLKCNSKKCDSKSAIQKASQKLNFVSYNFQLVSEVQREFWEFLTDCDPVVCRRKALSKLI
jgi:hypothetical protein